MISASKSILSLNNLKILRPKFCEFPPCFSTAFATTSIHHPKNNFLFQHLDFDPTNVWSTKSTLIFFSAEKFSDERFFENCRNAKSNFIEIKTFFFDFIIQVRSNSTFHNQFGL
jgi:hypothetical protein